jgi:CubicO group peptidase (beta-lactamase class C family)
MYKFEETIEKLCLEHTIAGMAVAVTDREKVIFAKGFGVDSVERPYIPADPISMYRI